MPVNPNLPKYWAIKKSEWGKRQTIRPLVDYLNSPTYRANITGGSRKAYYGVCYSINDECSASLNQRRISCEDNNHDTGFFYGAMLPPECVLLTREEFLNLINKEFVLEPDISDYSKLIDKISNK